MTRTPSNPAMLESLKRDSAVAKTRALLSREPLPNSLTVTKEFYITEVSRLTKVPGMTSELSYQVIDFATVFYHCEVPWTAAVQNIKTFVAKVVKHGAV